MEIESKQVIVVRKDLGMRKGKMIAQGAHASMAAVINQGHITEGQDPDTHYLVIPMDPEMHKWINGRFKKIAVSVNSEAELLEIHQKALDAGLYSALIQDAGLTEFGGQATYTSVAVGPNRADKVDAITGTLPLL